LIGADGSIYIALAGFCSNLEDGEEFEPRLEKKRIMDMPYRLALRPRCGSSMIRDDNSTYDSHGHSYGTDSGTLNKEINRHLRGSATQGSFNDVESTPGGLIA
jgi:hypothetical protein